MSTYKFQINKRHIVAATDSSHLASTFLETHPDAETEALSQRDIDVSIYLDDVLKHTVTLTDAGATLQFDADISQGDHTIKICAPKDPIQQTDICVDTFYIGDTVCVASQWDFNNQVLGTTSTLRQKVSLHNAQPHDYVWWGHVVHNDSSLDLPGPFYRAGIVSDHQAEWHFEFTKTASGHIWMTKTGDTTDILFDSTAQHTYHFVAASISQSTIDSEWETYRVAQQADSSLSRWQGPGTYTVESTALAFLNDSIDQSADDATQMVVLSEAEYNELSKGLWYHNNYTVTPITVT